MALRVSKGIPEAYSEPCQTCYTWAHHMKNLRLKMLKTHQILMILKFLEN